MLTFFITFVGVFLIYLLMVLGTGDGDLIGYVFHWQELVAGGCITITKMGKMTTSKTNTSVGKAV